jgi:nucleoside-diphosphate-sugar epimerase
MMLGDTYREQYGFTGAHLIPVNMYGENDKFDLINGHVVPVLIAKFINAKENNLSAIHCLGSGNSSRELFFAGDGAVAIVKSIQMNINTDIPINLGVGKDILIKDLAVIIKNLVRFAGDIIFDEATKNGSLVEMDGQPRRLLDTSRAKELLNWSATTTLKDGLTQTINWYLENRNNH